MTRIIARLAIALGLVIGGVVAVGATSARAIPHDDNTYRQNLNTVNFDWSWVTAFREYDHTQCGAKAEAKNKMSTTQTVRVRFTSKNGTSYYTSPSAVLDPGELHTFIFSGAAQDVQHLQANEPQVRFDRVVNGQWALSRILNPYDLSDGSGLNFWAVGNVCTIY